MWTADPRRARGFTFLEMTVTLLITALGALLAERAVSTTQRADLFLAAVHRATERGSRLSYEIRDMVSSSRRIFGDDATGTSYLDALDLSGAPRASGTRLPSVDELALLEPDEPGAPRTGNVLLVAREAEPAMCVADPATGRRRFIDTYRFVCVYPTVSSRRIVAGQPLAWDLVLWRSRPFPSLPQIQAIADVTERTRVVADLVEHFDLDMAWDPAQSADAGFFALAVDGTIALTPESAPVVGEDAQGSPGPRLVYAGMQLAATDPAIAGRQALFSVDDPGTWSPHGFEVKVVGPSGARKVGLRIVVEAPAGPGSLTTAVPTTVLASARDL